MFDLEKSIADWRRQMIAAGIQTPVPLEELENHLREEIERRMHEGTDVRCAFESAISEVGAAKGLKTEFEKNEKESEAQKWVLSQVLLGSVTSLCSAIVLCMAIFRWGLFREATPGQQLSGLLAIATFLLAIWGGRLGCRFFPVISTARIRDAILVSSSILQIAWWTIFARAILPHLELAPDQLTPIVFWNFFTPCGFFIGLNWGFEAAFRNRYFAANH
jgi:hypothetical protein